MTSTAKSSAKPSVPAIKKAKLALTVAQAELKLANQAFKQHLVEAKLNQKKLEKELNTPERKQARRNAGKTGNRQELARVRRIDSEIIKRWSLSRRADDAAKEKAERRCRRAADAFARARDTLDELKHPAVDRYVRPLRFTNSKTNGTDSGAFKSPPKPARPAAPVAPAELKRAAATADRAALKAEQVRATAQAEMEERMARGWERALFLLQDETLDEWAIAWVNGVTAETVPRAELSAAAERLIEVSARQRKPLKSQWSREKFVTEYDTLTGFLMLRRKASAKDRKRLGQLIRAQSAIVACYYYQGIKVARSMFGPESQEFANTLGLPLKELRGEVRNEQTTERTLQRKLNALNREFDKLEEISQARDASRRHCDLCQEQLMTMLRERGDEAKQDRNGEAARAISHVQRELRLTAKYLEKVEARWQAAEGKYPELTKARDEALQQLYKFNTRALPTGVPGFDGKYWPEKLEFRLARR